VALAVFVVPASASTPSLARLDGSALSNISLVAGSSLTFHAIGAAGSSVSVSGGLPVGWTVRTGTGGNMPTSIPTGTDRVFIEVTAEHNAAASGNINFSIGGANVPVSLTRTSTGTWNPGLLVVAADDGVVQRGNSINLTFRVARLGVGDGPFAVNVAPVGALPAGMSIGSVTINSGLEIATVALTTNDTTTPVQVHNIQFRATGTNVTQSDFTVAVDVRESDGGGATFLIGDANLDNRVNGEDVARIIRHITGVEPLAQLALHAGDANQDGQALGQPRVNGEDVARIIRHITGAEPLVDRLPVPSQYLHLVTW